MLSKLTNEASSNFQTTYKVSNKNNITQTIVKTKVAMSVSHDCAIAKKNASTRSFSEKSFWTTCQKQYVKRNVKLCSCHLQHLQVDPEVSLSQECTLMQDARTRKTILHEDNHNWVAHEWKKKHKMRNTKWHVLGIQRHSTRYMHVSTNALEPTNQTTFFCSTQRCT